MPSREVEIVHEHLARAGREAEFWSEQWATLAGLGAGVLNKADDMIAALSGDLGLPRGATREQAAPIIAARVDAWRQAREDFVSYVKAAQADLEGLAASGERDEVSA